MPTDMLKLVEASFAAFNDGDWDTMESLYWPDAEAQAPEGWPEAEDAKGWPAVRRQFERIKDSWAEDRFEVRSADLLDDGRIFVRGTWYTRGKGSGIEVDVDTWIIGAARDGKLARMEFYLDEAQAMRAAGK
jgi:ketosteroid isomerase-like protein